MSEKDIKGSLISTACDKIGEEYWVVIRIDKKEVMRVSKELWNNINGINVGFSPTMRDSILERVRRLYG